MVNKKSKNKRRIIWIILAIIIILIIIVLITRIYLYINVLIGNDLIIKLEADNENIFLKHGESETIKVISYAITNIFCKTNCTSKFIDLSSNSIIEEDVFNLKLSKTKGFIISAKEPGSGLKIYRFDIECSSPKTFLCNANPKSKKSSLLFTLNYELNDNEKSLKLLLENELSNLLEKIQYYNLLFNEFDSIIKNLEETTEIDELRDRLNKNKEILPLINKLSENLMHYWNIEDYEDLNAQLNDAKSFFSIHESEFLSLNDSVFSNLSAYNLMIDNTNDLRNKLENLKNQDTIENSTENLNSLIEEFNSLTIKLSQKDLLKNKLDSIESLRSKIENFSVDSSNNSRISKNLSNFNLTKIYFPEINLTPINLIPANEKCCLSNKCDTCCDNKCYDNNSKFPIIFLHGHSFNEKVSAQASLETFEDIQRAIEQAGYLNAGSLLLSSSNSQAKGAWQKINSPLSLKTSYYFDILSNEGKSIVIQTKTDNLDTYTLRLKDIINEVKSKTNRKKVIIIAHSMGGLIVRRYLQVFGEGDIEKIILITTPNKGISGNTLALCPVFGTKLECNDMDKDSLFMSKLNNAQVPQIPVYNIIGIGCETNRVNGDGVVTNSSQYLEYADNHYIDGTCNSQRFEYLHTEILDTQKYPQVSEILEKVLRDNSSGINM